MRQRNVRTGEGQRDGAGPAQQGKLQDIHGGYSGAGWVWGQHGGHARLQAGRRGHGDGEARSARIRGKAHQFGGIDGWLHAGGQHPVVGRHLGIAAQRFGAQPHQRIGPIESAGQRRQPLGGAVMARDMRQFVLQHRIQAFARPARRVMRQDDDGLQPPECQRPAAQAHIAAADAVKGNGRPAHPHQPMRAQRQPQQVPRHAQQPQRAQRRGGDRDQAFHAPALRIGGDNGRGHGDIDRHQRRRLQHQHARRRHQRQQRQRQQHAKRGQPHQVTPGCVAADEKSRDPGQQRQGCGNRQRFGGQQQSAQDQKRHQRPSLRAFSISAARRSSASGATSSCSSIAATTFSTELP